MTKTFHDSPLLVPGGTATIAATTSRFIVKDRFHRQPKAGISIVGEGFKDRFYGMIEEPSPAVTLRACQVLQGLPAAAIMAELGGLARVKSSVAALFSLLQAQPNGEPGILQTSGWSNIFYAKDKKGDLCVIQTAWEDPGWTVDVLGLSVLLPWNKRHQVFSPEPDPVIG